MSRRGSGVQEKTEEMATPSLADIAAAMKVLQPEAKKSPLEANIATIATAAFLGIAGWLLLGLNSMQQTVTQVSATVAQMSKQIDTMAQDAKDDAGAQSQMKQDVARLDQRVSALEGRGDHGNRPGQAGGISNSP